MSKKRPKGKGVAKDGWLVTFSDLMTLLLTFFVLLLSMSSLEVQKVMEITIRSQSKGGMGSVSAKIANKIEIIAEILRETPDLLEPQELLRDMFFPDEFIPEHFRQEFVQNVLIYRNQEGITIMLSDNILFEPNSTKLNLNATFALRALVEILQRLTASYTISGHTDATEEKEHILSSERALRILEYFIKNHIEERRFSVSAYGRDRPIEYKGTGYKPHMERRIEILLKPTHPQ